MNDNDKALVAQQGNLIQNFDDVNRIGKAMAASGYFKDAANVAQAIVKIMAGREMGFGPFASMNGINIIKGKPSVGANLMAAAIKGHPSYDYRLLELTPKQCVIAFFENGQKIGESHFTIEDAKKAGIGSMIPPGKPASMLEMFPRNLLFSRAISNGVRWYCPDVFAGNVVYTPDELDMGVETIDAPAIIVEAEIAESDSGEVADSLRPKKSLSRPYPAEVVRRGLHQKAVAGGPPASQAQAVFCSRKFREAFAPAKDAEKMYHLSLSWLWGVDSAKKLTKSQASATLSWLLGDNKPDESGDTPLSEYVSAEAGNVYRAALKEAGQVDMFD